MTVDEIINGILQREGGWRDQVTRPDGSIDPDTNLGITMDTFRRWAKATGHDVVPTVQELRDMTPALAEVIYRDLFIDLPGFTAENIPFEPLRIQLIDFGVNSGPERAVRWLQRVLRLQATGFMNRQTIDALSWGGGGIVPSDAYYGLINDALVGARSYMIDQAVDQGTMRKQDEEGVESRALSFFLARP